MNHKVLAYITRRLDDQPQLLVFTHRDFPEAGRQVPAGTVEPGEAIEAALFREIQEESGLTEVHLIRKLAEHTEVEWGHIRHVFQLTASRDVPDAWRHIVRGQGEDAGLVFEYQWADLNPEVKLAGKQAQWLSELTDDRTKTY